MNDFESKNCKKINLHERLNLGWFHRYPARFSTEILEQILSGVILRLGRLPTNLLDPFAGTGSSLSLAKQLNIPSVGKELTELGALIAEVRLNPPDNLIQAFDIAEYIACDKKKGNANRINEELILWIGTTNAAKLNNLLNKISKIKDQKLNKWLKLALSSALRPSSKWLPGSIKPQIDQNKEYSDINKHFLRVAKMLRKDCELEAKFFNVNCSVEITRGDSKTLEFSNNCFETVITSPPYGSMYDYYDVHRLSYLAFGWEKMENLQIGRSRKIDNDGYYFVPPFEMKDWYYKEFNGESTIKGRALRAYLQEMEKHFTEVYRVLKRNGLIAYSVANSIKKGKKFPIVESLAEILCKVGFIKIDIIPRKQSSKRILPAGRNIKTGRFDSNAEPFIDEYIIFARKGGDV